MKKSTVFYHKRLQKLMKEEEFRNTPMLDYALALINHVILMGMSGCFVKESFPVICPHGDRQLLVPSKEQLMILEQAFDLAVRIESKIYPGVADVCLGIEIRAFRKGPDKTPLFFVLGGVDAMGVRKLSLAQFDSNVRFFKK